MNQISRAVATLVLGIILLGVAPVRAHHGFESDVQVRLLPQQTFAVVRMTGSVASFLLGQGAPGFWNDAVVAEQQSRLQALAGTLLAVKAGETSLAPSSVKAAFEVSGQLAFVVIYPPAQKWPLTVEVAYFKGLGPQFTGNLRVFGPPQQPTERCGPEIATRELFAENRSLNILQP